MTKPNTAPTLSGLATKQATFSVEIPAIAADQSITVGKPSDADGDKVSVDFVNNGQSELTYDAAKGVILVAK